MNLVKRSLYICIGVLLLLVSIQGVQSIYQIQHIASTAQDVAKSSQISSGARQIWDAVVDVDRALQRTQELTDTQSIAGLRAEFGQKVAKLNEALKGLDQHAAGDTKAAAMQVADKVQAWLQHASKHVSEQEQTELPSFHVLSEGHTEVIESIAALIHQGDAAAATAVADTSARARVAMLWVVAELVLAIALGAWLGWVALRKLNEQLGADASQVAQIANAMADGDLTAKIHEAGIPAGSVMGALVRMQSALRDTVSRVVAISQHLNANAEAIATGNSDLNERTQQQAAALATTASTMAQLGTTVKHNADNSYHASALANEASNVALKGGTVVSQAVETMHGINDSSRKISDIIGVIDGIAFQTNILALNAAVEAARAGEQGRGFAVVAAEVRSLAQRSADAAKEIKGLITASVERVESGGALVNQAGHTMQEVVEAINRVSAVMQDIQAASRDQHQGVEQVGQAVSELDHATQQNSALAQDSARAAESLREQGRELAAAMTFFQVGVH